MHRSTLALLLLAVLAAVARSKATDIDDMPDPEIVPPFMPEDDDESSFDEDDDDQGQDEGGDSGERRKRSTEFDYAEVLHKSILFYEMQRSGKLPENNRIPWRGDSGLNDGSDVGLDLTGGWYDAGDHIKVNLPMAFSTTMLGWGLMEFWDAYEAAGELGNMLDSIRWPCEYFIKCHPSEDVYYYGVGNPGVDHKYWGRPEEMTMARPTWTCKSGDTCSDVAGETAAALATCSIAFNKSSDFADKEFSDLCLRKAESLYNFAHSNPGRYTPMNANGISYYISLRFHDELAWASLWLYLATGSQEYLSRAGEAIDVMETFDGDELYINTAVKMFKTNAFALKAKAFAFSWNDKRPGVQLLLYKVTKDKISKKKVDKFIDTWMKDLPRAPGGLSVRPQLVWGSNGIAANVAFLALVAEEYGLSSGSTAADRFEFAKQQIHYILGDGAGHSFMVGFGENPPTHPHHRGSTCPAGAPCGWKTYRNLGPPNANELTGAVVGGPDDQGHWDDNRANYVCNEVTTYYNSGFQSAVAGLLHHQLAG